VNDFGDGQAACQKKRTGARRGRGLIFPEAAALTSLSHSGTTGKGETLVRKEGETADGHPRNNETEKSFKLKKGKKKRDM